MIKGVNEHNRSHPYQSHPEAPTWRNVLHATSLSVSVLKQSKASCLLTRYDSFSGLKVNNIVSDLASF